MIHEEDRFPRGVKLGYKNCHVTCGFLGLFRVAPRKKLPACPLWLLEGVVAREGLKTELVWGNWSRLSAQITPKLHENEARSTTAPNRTIFELIFLVICENGRIDPLEADPVLVTASNRRGRGRGGSVWEPLIRSFAEEFTLRELMRLRHRERTFRSTSNFHSSPSPQYRVIRFTDGGTARLPRSTPIPSRDETVAQPSHLSLKSWSVKHSSRST